MSDESSEATVEGRLARVENSLAELLELVRGSDRKVPPNGSKAVVGPGSWTTGLTRGTHALDGAFGREAMTESVAELVMRLGDPETLASVTRIVSLAPHLEYAINGVAAGPVLLQEGVDLAKSKLAEAGTNEVELQRRIGVAAEALEAMSRPEVLRALQHTAKFAPSLAPVVRGAAQAMEEICEVEGDAAVQQRVADAVMTLAEPETLESLTRLATLAPHLEFAARGVAAMPTLLDEGIEFARERFVAAGGDPDDAQRATERALELAVRLGRSNTLGTLTALVDALPAVEPLVSGTASAVGQLRAVEGDEAMAERLSESVVRLAEPDTLDALTRIASLAPSLEYAVNAVAAGPALLEEGLDLAKTRLAASGADSDLDARLSAAAGALVKLTQPRALEALGDLGDLATVMRPMTQAAAHAMRELGAVEGETGLSRRLAESLVTVAQPQTLDALTRVAGLAPQLEYAAYFVAAGPALLEEAMELIRKATGDTPGGAQLQLALQAGLKVATTLGEPRVLASLTELAETLPALIPRDERFAGSLESLVRRLPDLTAALEKVDVGALAHVADKLDFRALAELADKVDVPALTKLVDAVDLESLAQLIRRANLPALATTARDVDLPSLLRVAAKIDVDALGSLLETMDVELLTRIGGSQALKDMAEGAVSALEDARVRDALAGLMNLAPRLEGPLRALPIQTDTLRVLSAVNDAVEKASQADRSAGVFGTLGALRDPDVQRAVGFVLNVASELGRTLADPPKAIKDSDTRGTN